jgi:NAD+ kinase
MASKFSGNKMLSLIESVGYGASAKNEVHRMACISPVQSVKAQIQLLWDTAPRSCLVVKKIDESSVTKDMVELCDFLLERKVTVFVEPAVCAELTHKTEYKPWQADDCDGWPDFCVCIGGDGTLLHLNSLFQDATQGVPPVISFAKGTLGFLTPFDFSAFRAYLSSLLNGHREPIKITPRMRLHCSVIRGDDASRRVYKVYQPLNEVLISRGSRLCTIDLFVDDNPVTAVKADGLIISTPTGSTAYSMSAGGPMVAPNVPAITMTPICPHSLNFRPVVLSDSTRICLRIPEHHKGKPLKPSYKVCFDGREDVDLFPGDAVMITTSRYSFPSVNIGGNTTCNDEWLHSIQNKLSWNQHAQTHPQQVEQRRLIQSKL